MWNSCHELMHGRNLVVLKSLDSIWTCLSLDIYSRVEMWNLVSYGYHSYLALLRRNLINLRQIRCFIKLYGVFPSEFWCLLKAPRRHELVKHSIWILISTLKLLKLIVLQWQYVWRLESSIILNVSEMCDFFLFKAISNTNVFLN